MTFEQAKVTVKAALGEPMAYVKVQREEWSVDNNGGAGSKTEDCVTYNVFFRLNGAIELGRGRFLDDAVNEAVLKIEKGQGANHGDIADDDPRLDVALDRAIDVASKL